MGIPDEDRGPVWLRDWQYIEADIQAMDDFANKLRSDVEKNYIAHIRPVQDHMTVELPPVSEGFPELTDLMTTHREATVTTTDHVRVYAGESAFMADTAKGISDNYRQTDAFARATVNVVEKELREQSPVTGTEQPTTGGY